MTEPGSCDTFTTDADFRFTEETTQHGWVLRITEVHGGFGSQLYRTDVIHPWLGVLTSFYWSHG